MTSGSITVPGDPWQTGVLRGSLRFIRYGFMPNRLRYCGPDENRTLLDYALAGEADGGLSPLLRQFTGAMPYLRLIAAGNGIRDPFDERVVEAYWIGNELLEGVEARGLYDAVAERVDRHLTGRARELILGKVPAGARPHHSFHVLDVYRRIGEQEETLTTLDSCRISWGRVESVKDAVLTVARVPLELRDGRLQLGDARADRVLREMDGHGFVDEVAIGDWVSIHWGWACEVLDARQRRNLDRYTRHHLQIANQTL